MTVADANLSQNSSLLHVHFPLCSMDSLVISEATRYGMHISEVSGTRSVVGNLDGVIFEVTLQ